MPTFLDYVKYLALGMLVLSVLIFFSTLYPSTQFLRYDNRMLWEATFKILFSLALFLLTVHLARQP